VQALAAAYGTTESSLTEIHSYKMCMAYRHRIDSGHSSHTPYSCSAHRTGHHIGNSETARRILRVSSLACSVALSLLRSCLPSMSCGTVNPQRLQEAADVPAMVHAGYTQCFGQRRLLIYALPGPNKCCGQRATSGFVKKAKLGKSRSWATPGGLGRALPGSQRRKVGL
jgi:hypothetical protein